MIIGNGLIANSLLSIDSEDVIYFASGVSNSQETRSTEFEREFNLLKNCILQYPNLKLVYFSTLSIFDQSKQNSLYVLHKMKIEKMITENCTDYIILRIGNVVGKGGNPNTLFNFLNTQISNQQEFTLHNKARRLLIDIHDISKFLKNHQNDWHQQTINLSFPYYYNLKEIITAIEHQIQNTAQYKEVDEGDFYQVEFQDNVEKFFVETSAKDYLKNLAQQYI